MVQLLQNQTKTPDYHDHICNLILRWAKTKSKKHKLDNYVYEALMLICTYNKCHNII